MAILTPTPTPTPTEILSAWRADVERRLRGHRRLAESALVQVSDADFFRAPDAASNSLALIVRHLSGNMRSRFTDFLTTDGEKSDRNRDGEFASGPENREELMAAWKDAWELCIGAIHPLAPEDLGRIVRISGEPHSVAGAITRHLAHVAYHVGQVAFIARHFAGSEWKTLSIPPGGSEAYSEAIRRKHEGAD